MARAKARFFLGLCLFLVLFYVSVLRGTELASYQYAALLVLVIAALVFDYLKVGRFLTALRQYEMTKRSHDLAIRAALEDSIGSRLLNLLGTELLTLYYAFFAKFEPRSIANADREFDYTKSSNANDVFLFVAFSQLPFLPLVHVLIEQAKGPGPAWLVTLLTLWSVIWYQAQVEAARFRPIELSHGYLKYRFGLFWSADIPLVRIKSARSIDVTEDLNDRDLFTSPMGSTKNVMLEFETPVRFTGPYFFRQTGRKAAISVDNPGRLLSQLAREGVDTAS